MKRLFVLFAVLSACFTAYTVSAQNTQNPVSTYIVGDYYNDGMKEGVVFEVSSGGRKGKIMSLNQSPLMPWTVCEPDLARQIGAKSMNDGQYNQKVVEAIKDWQWKYPAFDWCASLGEGWYLPSKEELQSIYKNRALLDTQLLDKISYSWSSTESDKRSDRGQACAWVVNLQTVYYTPKDLVQPVRAVAAFDLDQPVEVTGQTYALGDYYDDGVKQGVVFEVDYFGKRGKIVSMETFMSIRWCISESEVNRFFGADNRHIGKYNMWQIKQRPDWSESYPLHKTAESHGEQWYIPSVAEMERILNLRFLLTKNLPYALEGTYWTSTESLGTSNKANTLVMNQAAMEVFIREKSILNSRSGKKRSNNLVLVSMFDSTKPAAGK
jgi:hypothetical protein